MMSYLLLLALLLSRPAHAEDDILFLNLNNSPKEVEAAERAAKKTGRTLVVVPNDEEHAQIMRSLTQREAAADKKRKATCVAPESQACADSMAAWSKVNGERQAALEKNFFKKADLDDFLKARGEKPFTSVIVSGHDGTGGFSGELGRINDTELTDSLGKFPGAKDSIRSIHLLGCYSTSPGSLLLDWKKYFPNTALITGYEGRAPLNDKPYGWQYLQGVMEREPALLKVTDSAKLQKILRAIPGAAQVSAGISVCDNYATNTDHYNFNEMSSRCAGFKLEIEKQSATFECFMHAQDSACANPPENTGKGDLRNFYELLQKASACEEILQDPFFRTYSRDTAVRLIFARDVMKNFGDIYANELREVDALLAEIGAPADLRFTRLAELSRKELLGRADRLLDFLRTQGPGLETDPKDFAYDDRQIKIASLRNFQYTLTDIAGLGKRCVPFNWTEKNQSEKSECVIEYNLGFAGVAGMMKDSHFARQSITTKSIADLTDKITDLQKDNSDLSNARVEVLRAKIKRISLYRGGNPSPETLALADIRDERANLILGLTEKGEKNPAANDRVRALTLSMNKQYLQRSLSYLNEIKSKQSEKAARDADPSQEKLADTQRSIDLQELNLQVTQLLQAANGDEASQAQITELKKRIATAAREKLILDGEKSLQQAQQHLADAQKNEWSEDLIAQATKQKELAEKNLENVKKRRFDEWLISVDDALYSVHENSFDAGGGFG